MRVNPLVHITPLTGELGRIDPDIEPLEVIQAARYLSRGHYSTHQSGIWPRHPGMLGRLVNAKISDEDLVRSLRAIWGEQQFLTRVAEVIAQTCRKRELIVWAQECCPDSARPPRYATKLTWATHLTTTMKDLNPLFDRLNRRNRLGQVCWKLVTPISPTPLTIATLPDGVASLGCLMYSGRLEFHEDPQWAVITRPDSIIAARRMTSIESLVELMGDTGCLLDLSKSDADLELQLRHFSSQSPPETPFTLQTVILHSVWGSEYGIDFERERISIDPTIEWLTRQGYPKQKTIFGTFSDGLRLKLTALEPQRVGERILLSNNPIRFGTPMNFAQLEPVLSRLQLRFIQASERSSDGFFMVAEYTDRITDQVLTALMAHAIQEKHMTFFARSVQAGTRPSSTVPDHPDGTQMDLTPLLDLKVGV